MSRVNLFVVLAIILIVSVFGFSVPAQSAGEEFRWQKVSAEPNQLDQYESLRLMGLEAFSDSFDANSASKFRIESGVRLDATNFGKAKLRHHVLTDYGRSRRADVWLTWAVANMEVYRFQECGNFAYRVNWKPLDQSPIPGMIDKRIDLAMLAHLKANHHGLPWWWWLPLLGLLGLLRRGRPGLDGEDGKDGKDGKDAVIEILGATGRTAIPSEGARIIVIPTGSSADPRKPNSVEAGLLALQAKLDRLFAEKRELMNELLSRSGNIEERHKLLKEIDKLDEMRADLQKLIEATKSADSSAPDKKERSDGPSC
jgi:hypothetical protein